jgi:Glucose / Sorbosone dehydrogenase
VATGDGGDTPHKSPKIGNLKGKILRLIPTDPDGPGGAAYSVPASNPYVGRSGHDLVLARGLRNPWRCSHDRLTGELWCGDVGQNAREEINRVSKPKGVNFGWPKLEGTRLYPSGDPCTSNCRTRPIAEYTHASNPAGCASVTGGYVSRRSGAPLYGTYTFADFCSGVVWNISANHPAGSPLPAPVEDTNMSIASFGEGADGRLYIVDRGGSIWRLTDS